MSARKFIININICLLSLFSNSICANIDSNLLDFKNLELSTQKKLIDSRSQEEMKEEKNLKTEEAIYFHPGILILKNDKWNGGDYLYNLPNQMGVYVSVLEPEATTSLMDQKTILTKVIDQFIRGGIKPSNSIIKDNSPPLPFFQLQIMAYPSGTGYAVCCKGALFEEVQLKRINLDINATYQAITWQRESLFIASKSTFNSQLEKNITETVQSFIERFQFYYDLKSKSETNGE
jgi:hypothetical protein